MTKPTPDASDQAALFRKLAQGYDDAIRRYQPTYDAMLRLSTDLAGVRAPGRARCLDYGTGTGAALPLLGPLFDEIVAVDPGAAMLELARGRTKGDAEGSTRVSFIEGTTASGAVSALVDESCDAVHCSLVLMFVADDSQKLEVLKTFHRVLRSGGALVLTELVAEADASDEQTSFALWRSLMQQRGADDEFVAAAERQIHGMMHRRTVDQMLALLSRAGFRDVQRPFHALHTVMFVATT